MTDWIDFTVYVLLLACIWIIYPATSRRLAIPMAADRNPEWVAANPELVRRMVQAPWPLRLSYALGAASIAVLASVQVGLWTPPTMHDGSVLPRWIFLWDLSMASLFASIVIGGSIGIVRLIRLRRRMPVAPRRHASLARRSLDDFVPRWIQFTTYALVVANLIAWVVVALLGLHSSPVFWPRVVIVFALSGLFFLGTVGTIVRRPNAMDRIFGPGNRRGEVRYTFSMQLLPPIIGAVRLYEEVTNTIVFDINRTMQLCIALFTIYGLLRIAWLRIDGDGGRPGLSPHTAESSPTFS